LGLEKKARAVQLSVLSKYGVLADFSALSETVLDSALQGAVSVKAAQNMTFAAWRDQLLGPGASLPVARIDYAVKGQTKLNKLMPGHDLAKALKARDRQQQALIKASQEEIRLLKEQMNALSRQHNEAGLPEPVPHAASNLRGWYASTTVPLNAILLDIKEIDGEFFEYQGSSNKDYRKLMFEAVFCALNDLEQCGFTIEVKASDGSSNPPVAPSVTLYQSRLQAPDDYRAHAFECEIQGIQLDTLEVESDIPGLWQKLPKNDHDRRFNCHVTVAPHERLGVDEDDLRHLSFFVHKLFEALARSSDKRPRGALQEKVIICLLLSRTAPCMQARTRASVSTALIRDFALSPYDRSNKGTDISAGAVIHHLFQILKA